jgi:hypothetical protein
MKPSKVVFLLAVLVVLVLGVMAAEAKSQLKALPSVRGSSEPLPIAQNIELVKHEEGRVSNIATAGSYLYVGVGSELQVLSLSDPANPIPVGSIILDETIGYVYASGEYLYVGNYEEYLEESQLFVLNVSDPARPVLVSSLDGVGWVEYATVANEYLYLGTANGIDIVNVSDPTMPWLVSHFDHSPVDFYGKNRMEVFGEYLYLYDNDQLIVFDISDLTEWIEVYRQPIQGWGIALVGHYLYVLRQWDYDVLIFDLSSPAAPEVVGSYHGGYHDVIVEGNYVFLMSHSYTQPYLTILDAADPTAPIGISTIPVVHTTHFPFQVSNGYVYLMDENYPGGGYWLSILDATSPAEPLEVGEYRLNKMQFIDRLLVDESYLYLSSGGGLNKFDLSNAANPTFLGSSYAIWSSVTEFKIRDELLYTTFRDCFPYNCASYLMVFDVSNPVTPTLVSQTVLEYSVEPNVEIFGEYAYLWDWVGIAIYRITDPAQPVWIQAIGVSNPADLVASGDYLYIADNQYAEGDGALEIIDVSLPNTPVFVGSYELPSLLATVQVIGSYAYVVERGNSGTVHVIDVSEPGKPVEVSTYRPAWYLDAGPITMMAVEGHYAYLTYQGSVIVLDVSNSADPVEVAFYPMGGHGHYAAAQGNYFYVSGHSAGWFVLKQTPVMVSLAPEISSSLTYTYYQHYPTHFEFPAGVVTEPITVAVSTSTAEDINGFWFARHSFGLSALQGETALPDFTFGEPVTVTLRYRHEDVGVVSNEEELALWVWTEAGWADAATTCETPAGYVRDVVNNVLIVGICETGRFALFGPTYQRYLPLIDRR